MFIDTTLPSDNTLHFRKKIVKRKQKLIMIIDDKIKDKKLQYEQKYQHYLSVKLINMNILQSTECYRLIKVE